MKKATFLIPVAGMALTGCVDPIVGDWNITVASSYDMPYTYTFSYYGLTCSFQWSTTALSITEEFAASLRFDFSYDCFGYSSSESATYTGTVSVTEKKARYAINLTGEDALNLDCSMKDETMLDCTDQYGGVWSLDKLAD